MAVLVLVWNFSGTLWFWFFLQSDSQRIQGKWNVVSNVLNGQTMPKNELGYWIFEGEKVKIIDLNGVNVTADYRLDEDQQPGWLDLINPQRQDPQDVTVHRHRRLSVRGIYELDGYTLTICQDYLTKKRPTTFESKAGSDDYLWILRRE